MSRAFALGLAVGVAVGVVGGVFVGRTTTPVTRPETVVVDGAAEPASEPPPDAEPARSTRERVVPSESRPAAPERRGAEAIGGPPPPPKSATDGSKPKPVNELATWSEAQLLAGLERAARGDTTLAAYQLVNELRSRFPHARISLDLATSLIAAGHGVDLGHVSATFTDAEIRTVLERSARALPEERSRFALVSAAASLAIARGVSVEDTVHADLLTNSMPSVRSAGLSLAYGDPGAQREQVRRIAASDPEPYVRAHAIDVLMMSDSGRDAQARSLLLEALDSGSTELRSNVLHLVPELGPDAAEHALRLLIDEGYAASGDEAEPLVEAVLLGGLTGRLLAARPPTDIVRVVAQLMPSVIEVDPSLVAAFRPHLPTLAAAMMLDDLEGFYWEAAEAGFRDWVAREATATNLPGTRRSVAFEVLWEYGVEDDMPARWFVDLARSLVWDTSADLELRKQAMESLLDFEDDAAGAISVQLRVLRDHATPAGLRLFVLRSIADRFGDDAYERRIAEIESVVREVATRDPSAWLRGEAEDVIRQAFTDE